MRQHDPRDRIAGDAWEFFVVLDPELYPAAAINDIAWRLDNLAGTQNYAALSLTGAGIVFEDTNCGVVIVTVPASSTQSLAPDNYRDWTRITLANGNVLNVESGIIRVAAQPA